MTELNEERAASAADEEGEAAAVRIFVGGLGDSVCSDDLRKIFSSRSGMDLGIQSIEIIRSKGRTGFAYIDFFPSSLKSLSKLFSTYNGCAWKGGRLRLEKAKQHFLARLASEWAQDAAPLPTSVPNLPLLADSDSKKITATSEKPQKDLISETKQLRLYFPRLKKVKSIPSSGTGKHKYSFRRVEVPPLPTHFCDCEQHSTPALLPRASKLTKLLPALEEQDGGVNEKELDMMNSVMNRLFQNMENVPASPGGEILELDREGDSSVKPINNPQFFDENQANLDDDEDEENLIINMVSAGQHQTVIADQESRFKKRRIYNNALAQDDINKQKGHIFSSYNKKKKSVVHEVNDRNESMSALPGGKGSLMEEQSKSGNVLETLPSILSRKEAQPKADAVPNSTDSTDNKSLRQESQKDNLDNIKQVEGVAEPQPNKLDSASNKPGRGYSWLHESSWTQLVAGSKGNSFSISQILPGINFEKLEEPSKLDGQVVANFTISKHSNLSQKSKIDSTIDGTVDFGFQKKSNLQKPVAMSRQIIVGNTEASAPVGEKKSNSETKPAYTGDVSIGETCAFMRTPASLKEWARTKAALSGLRKRKSNGK